jgi:carboxymethylenebutenolidase
VTFYGYPPPEAADTTTIRMPLMGHFAKTDDFFPVSGVDDLENRLRGSGIDHVFHRYDARHAFCNEERPNYDPAAARIAWHRTVQFLARHLRR